MIETEMDGYKFFIGENKKENDFLVKNSEPDDFWVHISDYSSAHGVIKNPNKDRINTKVIKKICLLIKMKSMKCKSIKNLEFDVTRIKNLIQTDIEGQVIIKEPCKKIKI